MVSIWPLGVFGSGIDDHGWSKYDCNSANQHLVPRESTRPVTSYWSAPKFATIRPSHRKKGLNLYRLNSAKNTTSIRPVTTSITWPCASPSVPASRFHTAIHGVRLGLRLGIHALAFSVPSSQTCASGPGDSSRGTHPAKTLGVHRARPHQSQPSRQCNASTRFEHPTLERSHRFRRA